MKIAIVCYPTFGGSGVVATELGIALAEHGHEIHFITYKQPVRLQLLHNNVHYHEVSVPSYPLFHYQPYELALSSKLVNMAKLHEIEIVHVHYAIPHAYAGYMAKQMLAQEGIFIPMVTTLHGTDITLVGSHPFYKPAVTFSINNSDAVTSVSQSLKDDTLRLFNIKKEIEVVPNFIDTKKYENLYSNCERELIASNNEKIITHISNIRKVKRVDDVIEIFDRIQKELPAKLVIVGDGPEKESLENLCKKKGIDEKVLFVGNSHEVDKILCFSDLFILPSEHESFGLVALEAMVCGVPVISSNAGGLPEVNIHGESGYLSNVGNVDEMAKNALKILVNGDTHQLFKRKAKENAQRFETKLIVPLYEEIYKKSLAKTKQNITSTS
ncbi:N-acetyl-alpha-D-glucosaminyl L-malate synthase BshA [Flavobacteriaceae bacterium]|jgi:L-malate glycosyltransferase|nr:N-acetyl-alpha-D-glucosaminyl L-malate synthase BshA [Flavobacteriaceae bacterium]MDB3865991.1 N-acetyl-alpha-D-glucosaminyl L-malate synthase BshA [bacterium]MDC0858240.1 N-acetyl-alpha-D-glucosaminyl L-malate synthase BshA [Flavobacteriaceae bacterium]